MIEWWYWVVLGVILSVAEIFVLGFFLIWLGVSAIIVGIISFFIELELSYQILFWAIGSILLLWVWFGYLQGEGQSIDSSLEELGSYQGFQGEITKKLDKKRYKAVFEVPILGDREWTVYSKDELEVGDEVISETLNGQLLKVKKLIK
jgi:membrane protein implicated in regulation of membrane protease activity